MSTPGPVTPEIVNAALSAAAGPETVIELPDQVATNIARQINARLRDEVLTPARFSAELSGLQMELKAARAEVRRAHTVLDSLGVPRADEDDGEVRAFTLHERVHLFWPTPPPRSSPGGSDGK